MGHLNREDAPMDKIPLKSAENPPRRAAVKHSLRGSHFPRSCFPKPTRRDLWQRQCEVVQRFARNRFEVGFTTEEGNQALIAAGLPILNKEQMDRALKA